MGYLHKEGIVHRDIKPENLLLASTKDLCDVKVADFGLAKVLEGGKGSMQTVCGSPAYMAPEISSGDGDYTAAVDLWSIGVMMYLMLSGSLPFTGKDALESMKAENYNFDNPIWDAVSAAAKDVIIRLLKANPDERLTVDDALAHPWITGDEAGKNDLSLVQRKISLFNGKRKFKGIAHALIATNRMKNLMKGLTSAVEAVDNRAANSRGPGGPTGPLGALSRTPWILSSSVTCHRTRSRTSARTFGSTARPTAAH
jgi:serine/threonine protein kinase